MSNIETQLSMASRSAMEGVVKCYKEKFPEANIFTAKIPIDIMWGSANILEVKTNI
jgi:hypothetical protein